MTSVVLLNGPPGSGKDELAKHVAKSLGWRHDMFKATLYDLAAKIAGVPYEVMFYLANERDTKELPHTLFQLNGKAVSPRAWLIHTSETIVKPLLGKSYFGDALYHRIVENYCYPTVVSDSGFTEEAASLALNKRDLYNVYCIRIHRPGYTFEGDSRNYLPDTFLDNFKIRYIDLHNDSTLEAFLEKGLKTIKELTT